MSHFSTKRMHQQATYWEKTENNKFGEATVAAPVTINCRWQFTRREITNPKGEVVAIDALVVVDQDIVIGSAMALGSHENWLGTGSGGDNSEVMEVVTFEKVPDVKGRKFLREVGLAKYADEPPDLT